MNNTTDRSSALDEFNKRHTIAYIPAMVCFAIVIIAGFGSNLFAFLFYTSRVSKSVIHFFIAILSLNDALTSIILIYDIVGLCYFVNYTRLVVCKVFFFIKHWLVGNSIMLIWVIALDRHQLVCRPHGKKLTLTMGKYVVLGVILFSLFLSVHYLATGDIVSMTFLTDAGAAVTGYHCALSKQAPMSTVVGVFHKIDICLHVLVIGSMTVVYILVIKKIVHVKQRLKSHTSNTLSNNTNRKTNDITEQTDTSSSVANGIDNVGSEFQIQEYRNTQAQQVTGTDKDPYVNDDKDTESRQKQMNKTLVFHLTGPELKLSIMAFVITVASVVCFFPYYVSMMIEPNMDGKVSYIL